MHNGFKCVVIWENEVKNERLVVERVAALTEEKAHAPLGQ